MKKLIFAIALLASSMVSAEVLHSYKISKVHDGDTVIIEVDFFPPEIGNRVGLRIKGIDTPELYGKCIEEIEGAKKAKEYMKELTKKGDYKIVLLGRDKYFRLLGDIKIGEKYISELMIEKGYARKYDGLHKQGWCAK